MAQRGPSRRCQVMAGGRVLLAKCNVCIVRSSCSTLIAPETKKPVQCGEDSSRQAGRQAVSGAQELDLPGSDEVVVDAVVGISKGSEM